MDFINQVSPEPKTNIVKTLTPVLEDFVDDIFSENGIEEYLIRVFDLLEKVVVDSETKIDDAFMIPVVKAGRLVSSKFISTTRILKSLILNLIYEIVDANIDKYGNELFEILESYIKDTRTSFDDQVFLPVINTIKKVILG